MFGFSLPKLLVLAAILAAVWYGFKFVGRLDRMRKEEIKNRGKRADAGDDGPDDPTLADTEEMVQCPVCGVFLSPKDTRSCGKPDCPY